MKVFVYLLIFFSLSSCLSSGSSTDVDSTSLPEVTFETANLKLGSVNLKVEMAISDEQRARGLMFRRTLDSDAGMLFVFDQEEIQGFWMKNTFIPLSIGFFDANKILVDIQKMTPVKNEYQTNIPRYQSKVPAKYALEVPQGFFENHKIELGTKLEFPDKLKN